MKVGIKKTLSSNVKEMKKTDGGKAQVDLTNLFNISEKQVEGLVNHFDCDSAGGSKSIIDFDFFYTVQLINTEVRQQEDEGRCSNKRVDRAEERWIAAG